MFNVEILIPLSDNQGMVFTQEHHRVFESQLIDQFGGYSRRPGAVQGGWKNAEGTVFNDYSTIYMVAVGSILATGGLAKVVSFAKAHYLQEALMISYWGLTEIL